MHEADIASIQRQEQELWLPAMSHDIAWQLGIAARALAVERGLGIGVELRLAGVPVFTTLMAGTVPGTSRWLQRKAATVALFDRSTYAVWLQLESKGQTLAGRHALPDAEFAADGGGFPLRVMNAGLVGSLTVSGLDMRSDHEFAVAVLCRHLGEDFEGLALPTKG